MPFSLDFTVPSLQRALVILLATAPSITFARGETLLNAAVITGSTRYASAELIDVYAARIGQPVTRAMLDAIAADIEALYRRDGYVAPTIVVPDSEVSSATPRLQVLEVRIYEIALRGDAGPYIDTIMDRAATLRAGAIDRVATRKWLRELNTLPGLRVRAHFEPRGDDQSNLLLVLDSSYDALEGSLSVSNRGTEDLGRLFISGQLTANGAFGSHTAISVFGATTNEPEHYQFAGASLELPSSFVTTRINVSSSRARLSEDRDYDSERARLEFSHEVINSESWSVAPYLALASRDAKGSEGGVETSDVRTRTANIGALVRQASERSAGFVRVNVARGLDALGADITLQANSPPDIAFTTAGVELAFIQALSARWRMRIDVEGQWSDDDLPASERFSFGGATLGRAFDPAELLGDRGGALGLQLERVLQWQPSWLEQSSVFVQADYGYADDKLFGSDDAGSISAGFKASFASMSASLELSTPTLRSAYDDESSSVRAFAQVQLRF